MQLNNLIESFNYCRYLLELYLNVYVIYLYMYITDVSAALRPRVRVCVCVSELIHVPCICASHFFLPTIRRTHFPPPIAGDRPSSGECIFIEFTQNKHIRCECAPLMVPIFHCAAASVGCASACVRMCVCAYVCVKERPANCLRRSIGPPYIQCIHNYRTARYGGTIATRALAIPTTIALDSRC